MLGTTAVSNKSTWEVGLVIRILPGELRIKTKDPSLVLNGALLWEKLYKCDQCGEEFRKRNQIFRDSSKPTVHSQPYTNHLNKSLNQGCQTHFYWGAHQPHGCFQRAKIILGLYKCCLLYTSDAADETSTV